MQALTSLLPAQQDAAGWAELASYVRHASGAAAGRRGSSAGGVQLLSRLVAAAASRFPAEAEAAGLTERPLAPPPSMAHSAAATAAVSPVGTPAHGVPAAAVAAAATMAAATGAAAAAAAERQRAERQRAEQQRAEQQQPAEQQRAEQQRVEWLRAEQHRVIEEASQPALVTFVAESPAAAAALQRELGDAVRVVADGQEAQEEAEVEAELARRQQSGLLALTMVVTPGRDWPPDLQMVQLPFGVTLATEEDYDAVFEEQVGRLAGMADVICMPMCPCRCRVCSFCIGPAAAGRNPRTGATQSWLLRNLLLCMLLAGASSGPAAA